ncbi:hypothetical protein [Streptomyces sp. NPDC002769]
MGEPVGAATSDEQLIARPVDRARHGARARPAVVHGVEVSQQTVTTITTR